METAAKNAEELSQLEVASSSASVHQVMPPTWGKDTFMSRSKFTCTCFCCGKVGHKGESCGLNDAFCCGCGRAGHIQKVCWSKSGSKRKHNPGRSKCVQRVEENSKELSEDSDKNFNLYSMTSSSEWTLRSMTSRPRWRSIRDPSFAIAHVWTQPSRIVAVSPCEIVLRSYSGESIPVLGTVDVVVNYSDHTATLPLLVVRGRGQVYWAGIGCVLRLNWHEIF